MKREDWYKHRMLDCINELTEYLDLVIDASVWTDLYPGEAMDIRNALTKLSLDISKNFEGADSNGQTVDY